MPAEELPALIARLDGDDVETEEEGEELLVKLLRTASLPVAVAAKYYGFREMDTAPDIAPRCFALDDAPRKRALESQIGKLAASKLSRVLESVKSGVAVYTVDVLRALNLVKWMLNERYVAKGIAQDVLATPWVEAAVRSLEYLALEDALECPLRFLGTAVGHPLVDQKEYAARLRAVHALPMLMLETARWLDEAMEAVEGTSLGRMRHDPLDISSGLSLRAAIAGLLVELGKILTVELALPGTPTYGLYCCLFNVLLDAEPKLPQTAVPPLFQALRPLVPRVREDGELLHRAEKMLFSGVRVDAEDCRVMRSTLLMTIANERMTRTRRKVKNGEALDKVRSKVKMTMALTRLSTGPRKTPSHHVKAEKDRLHRAGKRSSVTAPLSHWASTAKPTSLRATVEEAISRATRCKPNSGGVRRAQPTAADAGTARGRTRSDDRQNAGAGSTSRPNRDRPKPPEPLSLPDDQRSAASGRSPRGAGGGLREPRSPAPSERPERTVGARREEVGGKKTSFFDAHFTVEEVDLRRDAQEEEEEESPEVPADLKQRKKYSLRNIPHWRRDPKSFLAGVSERLLLQDQWLHDELERDEQ